MIKTQVPVASKIDIRIDRPGWIPAEILHGWDTNPFAYQTEDELMPTGGLHRHLLGYVVELLRHPLEVRGQMLLLDTFLLYRDENSTKQRIAPDLLLMPHRFPPPSTYDLDSEPVPTLVVEVTSPGSHLSDLEGKVAFYQRLGVGSYLVIDAITPGSKLRRQFGIYYWRAVDGVLAQITPDEDDGFVLPEINVHIMADGQRLRLIDLVTNRVIQDNDELNAALDSERKARRKAEEEVARLEAELKKYRGEP